MKTHRILTTLLSTAMVLALSDLANATPDETGNCAECHGGSRDAYDIQGSDGTVDPIGGVGNLKYFDVLPEESVAVIANVTNGGGKYAPAVVEYSNGDWTEGSFTQGTGSSWNFTTAGLDHYYLSPKSANAPWTFDMAVASGVAEGYYPFTLTVAGGSEDWADSENFYVHVLSATIIGDMNDDGQLSDADISPFVLALTNRTAYDAMYSGVDADVIGDFNGNSQLDLGDVAGFKAAVPGLGAGTASAVPEPASAILLLLSLVGLAGFRGRQRL